MPEPTERFSSRVDNYVRYRPGYPPELLAFLREHARLTEASAVADIGSGTGIFAQSLLDLGCRVWGVEPNAAMRAAAEQALGGHARFVSVAATAEATALPPRSVDLVTAAQAFHWFDQARARAEFARILKPGGQVALIWNDRRTDTTPFLRAYEDLLRQYSTDYQAVDHKQINDDVVAAFFRPAACVQKSFANRQVFDLAGLQGRLLSSSYAPEAGHPNHRPMLEALAAIFRQHQQHGQVAFEYDAKVYLGPLTADTEAA